VDGKKFSDVNEKNKRKKRKNYTTMNKEEKPIDNRERSTGIPKLADNFIIKQV